MTIIIKTLIFCGLCIIYAVPIIVTIGFSICTFTLSPMEELMETFLTQFDNLIKTKNDI